MKDIAKYLNSIERDYKKGIASEHTYRPALQVLLESIKGKIEATNEPKRIKCGAPDFIITKGKIPIGYIETKDVGKSLSTIEKDAKKAAPKTHDGSQLKRYLSSLNNLILTDYLEFRWFYKSEKRLTVRIAEEIESGKIKKQTGNFDSFIKLFNEFLTARTITITGAKELADRMAAIAQLIRDIILGSLEDEENESTLHDQMDGFRKVLLHDLTEKQFADMYAQTICYGLFAARCNHSGKERFTREKAAYELPKTNPD